MSPLLVTAALHGGLAVRSREDAVFSWVPHHGVSLAHGALSVESARHRIVLAGDLTRARASAPWSFTQDGEPGRVDASPFTRVSVDWSTSWPVAGTSTASLGAGVATSLLVESTPYDHGFTGTFGYLSTLGLGPALRGRWRSVGVTVWTPLVAWVARSPYAANDDAYIQRTASHDGLTTFFGLWSGGAVRTLDQHQALHLDLDARVPLGETWALSGRLRTGLLHLSTPRPLLNLSATAELGLAVRL